MEYYWELVELINDFFGADAAYYGVDPYALAQHLVDNNVIIKEVNE